MAHLLTLITAALKPAWWIWALSVLIAIIPSHYILSNVGEPSWSWIISRDHIQVQKNLLFLFDVVVAVASVDLGTGFPYGGWGGGGGGGENFRRKVWIKPPKKTNLGVARPFFDPPKENILNFAYMNRVKKTNWKYKIFLYFFAWNPKRDLL